MSRRRGSGGEGGLRVLGLDTLLIFLVIGLVAFMQTAKSLQTAGQVAEAQHRFLSAQAAGLCTDLGAVPGVPHLPEAEDPVRRLQFLQTLAPVQAAIWRRSQECQEPRTVIITEDLLHFEYSRHDRFVGDWRRGIAAIMAIVDQNIRDRNLIHVVGHTDERGSEGFNYELSYRRALFIAMEIRRHLERGNMRQGSDYQLYPFGMGKSQPATRLRDESAEEWWTKCRRVELSFRSSRAAGGSQ